MTVVDAALWGSAEATPIATRDAPMDPTIFPPPGRAYARSPGLAHVHNDMHAKLLHRIGSRQHNTRELQMACKVGGGGKGGHELHLEQQQHRRGQQEQHPGQQLQPKQQQQQ